MASNNTYFVEFAKSGRSKCKKCREPIQKGEMRIVTEAHGEAMTTTVSVHPACFGLPRRYATGANKITAAEFVQDVLEDRSEGGEILPSRADELATAIEAKAPKKKAGDPDEEGGAAEHEESPVAALKRVYEARNSTEEGEEQPPAKKKAKSKKNNGGAAASKNEQDRAVELYGTYHKSKNDDLKDMLRWNRQVMVGTKDALLFKVIDGALHGRLARCALCGGRLKLQLQGSTATVTCGGSFDENSSRRIDCAYTASPADAPRCQPWFTQEPSEEENEEMDRLEAVAKGEDVAAAKGAADSDDVARLKEAAGKLEHWKLTSRDGLRAAAQDMVRLLREHAGGGKTVDVAEDQAVQKVGQLIAANKDKSAVDLIPLIVGQFGFVQDKQAKAEQKQAAIKTIVKNPANAALVAAFQELMELYFKAGNSNAGITYRKVVAALQDLDFEVTEANAKGLCKGKTKVANIGKASAEKIFEFVTTGTIGKLEEKRADAA